MSLAAVLALVLATASALRVVQTRRRV